MGIQYTTNFRIPYLDDSTPLSELDTVSRQTAEALDAAMGKAGYVPPDSSSFAALSAKVTDLKTAYEATRTQLVPAARSVQATAPAVLPMAGGWAMFDPPNFEVARFVRDQTGRVTVKGLIRNNNAFSGLATMATLPAGFRPRVTALCNCTYNGVNLMRVDIQRDGAIVLQGASNVTYPQAAHWNLDLSFFAAESTISTIA